MAPFSVRPPVHSTTVSSPWAASTEIACSTLARQDAVENGRTMPVVPRIEIPPMMPSLALVVLRAIRSPSGTEMITVTPFLLRSTASLTAWVIIARGTGLMAGPPSSSPRPGLVTTPTPTPPSSSMPGAWRQRTVAVSRAPWVTSGSSPASLTTTASAWVALSVQASTGKRTLWPSGSATSTACWIWPVSSAVVGRLGRGGRAGPGGPAGAQRLLPHLRRPRQVGFAQLGIGAHDRSRSRSCFLAWGSAFRYPWKWPGWYRCERLPVVASAGPTSTRVCFHSLRCLIVSARFCRAV